MSGIGGIGGNGEGDDSASLTVLLVDVHPAVWGGRLTGHPPHSHSHPSSKSHAHPGNGKVNGGGGGGGLIDNKHSASSLSSSSSTPGGPPPSSSSSTASQPQTVPLSELAFGEVANALAVFVSSSLLCHSDNRIAVIAYGPDRARFVYPPPLQQSTQSSASASPSPSSSASSSPSAAAAAAPDMDGGGTGGVAAAVLTGLIEAACDAAAQQQSSSASASGGAANNAADSGSLVAGALSLALCYINRVKGAVSAVGSAAAGLQSRVMAVTCSADRSAHYVPVMNAIFSAQKLNVPIDALVLSDSDSLLMQQATHLTSGLYYRQPNGLGIVQTLMARRTSHVSCRLAQPPNGGRR
jgi:hypothetical protein